MGALKVYGADSCADTVELLAHLDDLGVVYTYIDIKKDPKAAAWVRHQNDGKEKTPTVDVGGIILQTPGALELDEALSDARLIPKLW